MLLWHNQNPCFSAPAIDNKRSLMLNTLLPGERNCESKVSCPSRQHDGTDQRSNWDLSIQRPGRWLLGYPRGKIQEFLVGGGRRTRGEGYQTQKTHKFSSSHQGLNKLKNISRQADLKCFKFSVFLFVCFFFYHPVVTSVCHVVKKLTGLIGWDKGSSSDPETHPLESLVLPFVIQKTGHSA